MNRDLQYALYYLKRQRGQQVVYHARTIGDADDVDYITGIQTIPRITTVVERAIVLPVSYRQRQQFAMFAANFKFGGDLKIGDMEVIIDKNDLTSEIKPNDYVVFNGKRFDVVDHIDLDDLAWHIAARSTQDEPPMQIIDITYYEKLNVGEVIS